ncbi:hypothetical protein [Frankia nepalensis]|uniref:Uncharacterized protein n=1 Tax=Frankia nepalensis TaxID=1836974 RepID=A0A937REW1_9ACTN|nr:hypothetical protein [Frankia nepalensis]MBL7627700.1 hypothetical protein [Frankia nepalensis]
MPRSAKAASNASDAAGDGGMGAPSGMTSEISLDSRRPRPTRKSWTSRVVSLGAGGHSNGVEVTADHPPAAELVQHRPRRERARHGVELVPGLDDEPWRRRRRVQVGAERDDHDVALERAGIRLDRRASGSMARIAACTNRTPGLTSSR